MRDPEACQGAIELVARLVLLRQWLGHSQEEMAARLGMQAEAYADWENPRLVRRLNCVVFLTTLDVVIPGGIDLNWLIAGDRPANAPPLVPLDRRGRPMRPLLRVVQ